jgi:esterase/lipase
MRTRKYTKKKKQTKKIRGGVMNIYEYEILKLQRVIDKYGESDRENLQELQDKINQAIINYIMKSSTEKKQIIDKINEIYDKTFAKREKIE